MRPQVRPSEPEVLKANSQKWNDQWVKLKTGNPSASFSWYRIENQSARDLILPALREMNQRHCSFCDSFPLERQGEPIEHFRPKSDPRFLHLAYTWTNLPEVSRMLDRHPFRDFLNHEGV